MKKWSEFMALRSNYGKLVLMIGVLVAVPVIVLPFYPEEWKYASAFLLPSAFSILLGMVLCAWGQRDEGGADRETNRKRGSLTILFAWGYGFLAGAAPFVLAGLLTPVQAFFESVSGWTTTGLSSMDVTHSPQIFLFHRSFMQFCGGVGFVMMMVMLVQSKQSMNLYSAEGHPDKLKPNLKKTARLIFLMYNGFLLVGTAGYMVCGMTLFDGVCHAMCSLSTGGFSTKLMSIGGYDSTPIYLFTIFLMLVGTTNFAVLLLMIRGKWKQVFQVSEFRFMCGLLLTAIPLTAWALADGMGMAPLRALETAAFDICSALSTTGYSSMSYADWPSFAVGMLILMMLIGGGIGSTAGGLKMTRVYLMLRVVGQDMKRRLSPRRTIAAPYYFKAQGKTAIDPQLISDTAGFFTCYLLIYAAGSLLLTVTAGCTLTEAMFDFASALGTVGLSIGITGPKTNDATLLVEAAGMILGRLEIFVVFTGICGGASLLRARWRAWGKAIRRA